MTLATRVLLATLLVWCLGILEESPAVASTARTLDPGTGITGMADQVLRIGCRAYPYTYDLAPTTGDWILEAFLFDPDRQRVAAGVFGSDSDPDPGTSEFRVCRSITRFGVFKLRAKLTTYDGYEHASTWIEPTYVRLHRSGR